MNDLDILDLLSDGEPVTLEDGERILTDGQSSDQLFVLVSGALVVERHGVRVVQMDAPGSIVGEVGLLLDQPAGADVIAVGPTVVRRIDGLDELLEHSPEFMAHLARTLARRLFQVTSYLTDLEVQFADSGTTLGLVPTVLQEIMDGSGQELDVGSEREPDSPY
ncbi:Crp/Fnr family transcriptional regulator [Ilumatobacter nonamiensis]|uniref:Crp/Fnr family transcriptional regulator n=1 Tax=Ilumatobacter nonamiensis TaxID=467093 RepID=UPI000345EA19|nr:cyclic nucleotide-binding domain-containing protein [Ilumatobacter nonamiensis]